MRIILFTVATVVLVSCLHDKTIKPVQQSSTPVSVCDTINTDFATVIKPLFLTNCSTSGCHDTGGNSGGYTYETYAQIAASAEEALNTMNWGAHSSPMPKFKPQLPDTTRQKVECWINKGKPQ